MSWAQIGRSSHYLLPELGLPLVLTVPFTCPSLGSVKSTNPEENDLLV